MIDNERHIVDGKPESWDAAKKTVDAGATLNGTANMQDLPECLEATKSMGTRIVTLSHSSCVSDTSMDGPECLD